ncbi:MAG: hypothetical protein JRH11_27890 [Deltaproteobacteria bacterium]|nr:hypothetical protein [Deltaproteobacteria bacterium]
MVDAGLTVGAQWDATDELSFGVSFESPTLAFFGQTRTTSIYAVGAITEAGPFLDSELKDDGDIEASADPYEPARIRSGVSLAFPKWRIAADVDVALPLSSPNVNVDRALMVNGRLGGAVTVKDGIEVGFSVFTDLDPGANATERIDFIGGSVALHTESRLGLADEEDLNVHEVMLHVGSSLAF